MEASAAAPLSSRLDVLAEQIRSELVERRRAQAVAGEHSTPLQQQLGELVEERAALLSANSRAALLDRVLRNTVGLGPLESLLADPSVDEILVNGHDQVWVEREGRLERCELSFDGPDHLRDVIERVLGPLGRRVDELSPMADGRLADGSRVNVVIPPLAVDGPQLSIRRFVGVRPGPEQLVERGTLPADLLERLAAAVGERRNLLISGGTGSGKTTVLNALSTFIAGDERVITIEDAAELRLTQEHVVRLETRPASVEGSAAVSIRDLVRNALRMRPDRIVIGEVRGAEAMDLLQALNTGHRGALSTIHANSPVDAVRRVETLALSADLGLPYEVLRAQVATALDLVLHLQRGSRGQREALSLAEVVALGEQRGPGAGSGVRELWSR